MTLNVVLMVLWIVSLAQAYYWGALALGTVLFACLLAGLIVYLALTIKEVRLNQRQANFVDSVTHELKSPIASLKLCLETLVLRDVPNDQRAVFYRSMIDDLNRLDELITQLLEVGRLDAIATDEHDQEVDVGSLIRQCAVAACRHHRCSMESIDFRLEPARVRARPLALEMIFRNLIDNALKYGGTEPKVEIELKTTSPGRVIARVADNGQGVPPDLREKIFGLFFRGGSELERTRKGTGLGLYIVHTLVRRMRGRVSVRDRGRLPGAVFEVELPGIAS